MTQPYSLKALANKVLERNSANNTCAIVAIKPRNSQPILRAKKLRRFIQPTSEAPLDIYIKAKARTILRFSKHYQETPTQLYNRGFFSILGKDYHLEILARANELI